MKISHTVTIRELVASGVPVECHEDAMDRPIVYKGKGWYSLHKDGKYYAGRTATFSRIFVGPSKENDSE